MKDLKFIILLFLIIFIGLVNVIWLAHLEVKTNDSPKIAAEAMAYLLIESGWVKRLNPDIPKDLDVNSIKLKNLTIIDDAGNDRIKLFCYDVFAIIEIPNKSGWKNLLLTSNYLESGGTSIELICPYQSNNKDISSININNSNDISHQYISIKDSSGNSAIFRADGGFLKDNSNNQTMILPKGIITTAANNEPVSSYATKAELRHVYEILYQLFTGRTLPADVNGL